MNRTRFAAALVLVLAAFAVVASCAGEGGDPGVEMKGVVQMNMASFNELVGKERAALVEFYAPWCGHCKSMAGDYAALGQAYSRSKNAKDMLVVAKVDGTEHRDLGKRFEVTGFPTILFFPAGSSTPVKYQGGRTADEFVGYLTSQIKGLQLSVPQEPQFATELQSTNFDELVKDPSKAALVMFYAPWCGHCKALKPTYSEVAKVFANEKDVVIARINADAADNKAIAAAYDIKGFPTVYFFPKGADAKPIEYKEGRELEDFVTFVNEHAGTHRLLNGDLSWDFGVVDALSVAVARVAQNGVGAAAQAALADVKAAAEKAGESESVAYYVKAAERIAEKGADYVATELARLQRTLDGSVAGERRDNMLKRVNILTAIQKSL